MSTSSDSRAGPPVRVAVGRAALFLAFWLMSAGYQPADLPVGLLAAAAATWASLRLLPPTATRLRLSSLIMFSLHFFRQSVISGIEVARIACDPRLPLRAGFVVYRCRLRSAGERGVFCALSSLLPGTLPTGTNEDGDLLIHCLDVTRPVVASLTEEETLFTRVLRHD
ncbi:MAG: sodium:proton antiporter [Rhodospirillales bacterium]|nr:sodium:proton antiporter [Rhodospirillales bacterium]